MEEMKPHHIEGMKPFKHLWRLDDPAWVKQRQQDWKIFSDHYVADFKRSEKMILKRYFLEGFYVGHMRGDFAYFLTPFTNSEEARLVFEAKLFSGSGRREIFSYFLEGPKKFVSALTWHRRHVQDFVAGVMGNTYRPRYDNEGQNNQQCYTPPTWFSMRTWGGGALVVLKGRGYHGCMECIDYFISCLAASDDTEFRDPKRFEEIFALARAAAESPATPYAEELAANILAREAEIRAAWAVHAHLDVESSPT